MTIIYGAGIADSNDHSPINVPFVLAGGGAGNLKGGRHTHFNGMPLANLHLTLLDQLGVHRDRSAIVREGSTRRRFRYLEDALQLKNA